MAEKYAPGKYEFVSSDNFDEYLKAVGVGYATRLIVNKLKPSTSISIDDNIWKIVTSSTFKTTELKFSLDTPFDETTGDGRKVNSIVTVDGEKLVHTQKGDPDSVITRSFTEDGFKMTLEAKGVVATREYKKV